MAKDVAEGLWEMLAGTSLRVELPLATSSGGAITS
jgi:hypothetical protein